MPHVTVEYSANLADVVDPLSVVAALHAAALQTGIAPPDALRTRAEPREIYLVGDGDPGNIFVSVLARLGPGRTADQQRLFLEALMEALEAVLGTAADNAMLSVEFQEIDETRRINTNNLRTRINERASTNDSHGRSPRSDNGNQRNL